jgi:hypothetical protein
MLFGLFEKNSGENQAVQMMPLEAEETIVIREDGETITEAELRRRMYERIARGNALIEAEENARRKWRGG